jgi:hypothetical protein
MARILFIDDKRGVCNNMKQKLTDLGHTVETIANTLWSDALKEAQSKMNEAWDVLVLDIHYDSQHDSERQGDFGGIWLYNGLVKLGLRTQWRHTIVYSRYVPTNWNMPHDLDTKSGGLAAAVRVFLDTADIPCHCALPNDTLTPDRLSEKITSL